MFKTSQKAIKVHAGKNITRLSFNEIEKLRPDLEKIAFSVGVYGINGALFINRKTGEFFKITARSSALFQLV